MLMITCDDAANPFGQTAHAYDPTGLNACGADGYNPTR